MPKLIDKIDHFLNDNMACVISGAVTWVGSGILLDSFILNELVKISLMVVNTMIGGAIGFAGKLIVNYLHAKWNNRRNKKGVIRRK